MRVSWSPGNEPRKRARVDDFRALGGVVVDLFVRSRREEAGKGMHRREKAGEGHRTGLRDHVLLGDAALEKTLREALAEFDQAGVLAQVGVERHQAGLALGLLHQLVTVGVDEPLPVLGHGRDVLRRIGVDQLDRVAAKTCQPRVQPLAHLLDRALVLVR